MQLTEDWLRLRLGAMEGFVRWVMVRGMAGAPDGMVAALEGGVFVGFWRDGGGAMFELEGDSEEGVLYAMQVDMPAGLAGAGGEIRDRVLAQMGAVSAYDYALAEIRAAAEDKREVLDLSGQGLDVLPAEIGRLTELLALDLSRNRLHGLPGEIGKLKRLEELVVEENELDVLPAEIGELEWLTTLVLDQNRLVELPAEIGRLRGLRTLQILRNRLLKLPGEIGELVELRRFWLQSNQLTELPVEMSRLVKLKDWDWSQKRLPPRFPVALMLDGNPLVSPPMEVVRKGTAAVLGYLAGIRK